MQKISRRQFLKTSAAVAGGLALSRISWLPPEVARASPMDRERYELAQRYKVADPGQPLTVGHITFQLSQEYAMMVYQANEQAAKQLGLRFLGAVAQSDAAWIQQTQSMIAAGAKIITYNCPSVSVIPQLARICNENKVFMGTYFGYTNEFFPGDFGPYWVIDNTPMSDYQTFFPLAILFQKMREHNRTKLLHLQASKTNATISQVYINLGVLQAWTRYPEMQVLGHQWAEWNYEGGRGAAEAALAVRQDYEGLWGANDSVTTGAVRAFEDRGIQIGPWAASRDMELTTAQEILDGNFLVTAGFAIPYFGGRLVPMLYDMAVGAWYPKEEEMIQTGTIDVYGAPGEVERLVKNAGLDQHPNLRIGPLKENMEQILMEMKKPNPQYPYDFRLMSYQKTKELGKAYDRHAGAGTELGSHDFLYPARLEKFGSLAAFKAFVRGLYDYFLDFSIDTWDQAERFIASLPPEVKIEPIWS